MTFLDTNILFYAVGFHKGDPREEPARSSLAGACLSAQALAELAYRLSRGNPRAGRPPSNWPEINGLIEDICQATSAVFALEPPHLSLARNIAQTAKLSYFDAQMIAVAASNGGTMLLSEDLNHGQTVEGVRIVNPFR